MTSVNRHPSQFTPEVLQVLATLIRPGEHVHDPSPGLVSVSVASVTNSAPPSAAAISNHGQVVTGVSLLETDPVWSFDVDQARPMWWCRQVSGRFRLAAASPVQQEQCGIVAQFPACVVHHRLAEPAQGLLRRYSGA